MNKRELIQAAVAGTSSAEKTPAAFFLLPAVVTGVGLIIFGLLFRHGRNSKSTR